MAVKLLSKRREFFSKWLHSTLDRLYVRTPVNNSIGMHRHPCFFLASVYFHVTLQEFLVRSAKMVGAHYPERSEKIFILNAPWWFNVVWKVRCLCFLHRAGGMEEMKARKRSGDDS